MSHSHYVGRGSHDVKQELHEVNQDRMQQVIHDPSTSTTGVYQYVLDFGGLACFFFQPKGLVLQLASDEVGLIFRPFVTMVRFNELPVLRSVKMRGFNRSRP